MTAGPDLENRIATLIREAVPSQFKKAAVTPDMRLQRDLGLDSLGIAALLFRLQDECGLDLFADPDLPAAMSELRSVGDLIALAVRLRS